ncbi:unnamed protein product, partial [Ectocarpus sp. 12 AP-2014]
MSSNSLKCLVHIEETMMNENHRGRWDKQDVLHHLGGGLGTEYQPRLVTAENAHFLFSKSELHDNLRRTLVFGLRCGDSKIGRTNRRDCFAFINRPLLRYPCLDTQHSLVAV